MKNLFMKKKKSTTLTTNQFLMVPAIMFGVIFVAFLMG